jgi:hypothetical protein
MHLPRRPTSTSSTPGAASVTTPRVGGNVALRAVTPAERYEEYEPVVAQECPF